jgi:hypothetical protein
MCCQLQPTDLMSEIVCCKLTTCLQQACSKQFLFVRDIHVGLLNFSIGATTLKSHLYSVILLFKYVYLTDFGNGSLKQSLISTFVRSIGSVVVRTRMSAQLPATAGFTTKYDIPTRISDNMKNVLSLSDTSIKTANISHPASSLKTMTQL